MINNNLSKGMFVGLLLASPFVGAEPQYPAPFEPVILYQDADLIAKHNARQPQATAEPVSPRVESRDTASSHESKPYAAEAVTTKTISNQEEASMDNFAIILVILALAGFVFWNSRRSGCSHKPCCASETGGTGETGVTRYLNGVSTTPGSYGTTGVARYLSSLDIASRVTKPGTGVATYITKIEIAARISATETGVARYLKRINAAS